VQLKDLVADAADLLVKGHGFTRAGRNFIREDELVRGLRFRTGVSGSFEILFDLGITGISQIGPKTDKWTVGGSASQLRPKEIPARAWMRLTEGAYDEEVRKAVHHVCERIAVDFLLKYRSGEEFFLWVRETALELFESPEAENEFRRLKLHPLTPTRLLELAGVYAAYLGKSDDASILREAAIEFASSHGIDYAIPDIIANIADASRHKDS
jgi:hypothetical protein